MALVQNLEVLHRDSPVRASLGLHTAWTSLAPLDQLRYRAKQKAACIPAWTCCRGLSRSGIYSNWQPSISPNKRVAPVFPNVMYAASKSQKPTKCSASSLLIGIAGYNSLSFTLERLSHYGLDLWTHKSLMRDFPGGTVVNNLPANAGDTGSIPGAGRSHMLQSN